jgi:hypothetical protein
MASATTSTVPTAWNRRDTSSESPGVAKGPRHIAEAPRPTEAGVFGITRMMRHGVPPPGAPSMVEVCAMLMPADTDTTSVEGFSAPFTLSHAEDRM